MPLQRTGGFLGENIRFEHRGINLSNPIDRLPPGKVRIAENLRRIGDTYVTGRQGIESVSTASISAPVNSIFSFSDPVADPQSLPGAFSKQARLLGGQDGSLWAAAADLDPADFEEVVTGFSGNPLSFVIASSDTSPRPWTVIYDSVKMRKISSATGLPRTYGVAPPNFAPTAAIGAADPNGPDIGTSGLPYVYLLVARGSAVVDTNATSNPGPAIRNVNGLSPSSASGAPIPPSDIIITIPQAHPDPQVRWLDVYRFGGSIPRFIYIGTVNNIAGETLTDSNDDAAIASNQELEIDNNQPFLTVDQSVQGTATITALGTGLGATVTITSGDHLAPYDATGDNPYYIAGNQISVGGSLFTFYRSPDSATSVEVLEDPPTGLAGGDYIVTLPQMAHQPLECAWGPYGGGETGSFIFACGDPLRPGALYWTKGNHPESHPGVNVLDITSSSEQLMNGDMYNGQSIVWSNKRMFQIYPTFGGVTDFIAIEVPNSKGLFARWGKCVTPYGLAFVGQDGIYLTTGGSPVSLTDDDLYPIFPHEGDAFESSAFPTPDGMLDTSFSPIDYTNPQLMQLKFGAGFLKFFYPALDGNMYVLVGQFDAAGRWIGWISRDSYIQPVLTGFYEQVEDAQPGAAIQKWLLGLNDGELAKYGTDADLGNPINGHIRTGSYDCGDSRPRKPFYEVEMDIDSQCDKIDVKVGFDNFTYFSDISSPTINLHGRRRVLGDINAGLGQYAFNIGLDISWAVSDAAINLYYWEPSWLSKPELSALRASDWDDLGYQGAKFIQGFIFRCDTLGIERNFDVLSDSGNLVQNFTVTAINEQEQAFVFDTPFISHLVRIHPRDANFWRYFVVRWIFQPAPELVTTWKTPATTHDLQGYFHYRDSQIALLSSDVVTFTCTMNGITGSPFSYSIASTGSLYAKNYLVLQPMKAKEVEYSLTSPAGFRLFVQDCEVRIKQWGVPGSYQSVKPFGDLSRMPGAEARI
ncbi:MAG TPA: hypothetical protein VJQ59_16715 [Candidatus Sulfotelmatobacter sp.]|nr:hypothetical protein [Candidatus Sulfotelmatobacter sp.]